MVLCFIGVKDNNIIYKTSDAPRGRSRKYTKLSKIIRKREEYAGGPYPTTRAVGVGGWVTPQGPPRAQITPIYGKMNHR